MTFRKAVFLNDQQRTLSQWSEHGTVRAPGVLLAVSTETNAFLDVTEVVMNHSENVIDQRRLATDDKVRLAQQGVSSGSKAASEPKPSRVLKTHMGLLLRASSVARRGWRRRGRPAWQSR